MTSSPLSLRCEVVKSVVTKEFNFLSELEKRRMETIILQILAPIYAPTRGAIDIDAEWIFRVALTAKRTIDEHEESRIKAILPQLYWQHSDIASTLLKPVPLRLSTPSNNLQTTQEALEKMTFRPIQTPGQTPGQTPSQTPSQTPDQIPETSS